MFEQFLKIETADGVMPTFVVHPERRHAPLVLMLMDGPGMRETLRDQARRLASVGYFVVLPNFYYRKKGPLEDLNLAIPEMRELVHSVTNERFLADARASLGAVKDRPEVKRGPIGTIGYCFGGRLALVLAEALGPDLAAAVSLHPGAMVTAEPESPHRNLGHVRARVYLGCCEEDAVFPPDAIESFRRALVTNHVVFESEVHPGTHHGYSLPDSAGYQRAAAERAWERTFALFGECLR